MKVLLVSPAFHGYWRSIERALAARGHAVTTHVYDDFAGLRSKARNKLAYELPDRMGGDGSRRMARHLTGAARAALLALEPDAVVVVKGDVLEEPFWDCVVDRRHVAWLYDELRRLDYDDATLQRLTHVASYSARDVATLADRGIAATHLPLAFDPSYTPTASMSPASREVVFVGARYPNREAALLDLKERGIAVKAFGRGWSRHVVDRLRTWELRRPALSSGRDLDRQDAYTVMARAAATLNIHGDQDGFTMRTFEACGIGAVQLIDRVDVRDLYEPGVELATFESPEELADLCRRAVVDRAWAAGLREAGRARTLADHTFDARVAVLEELWQG